MKVKKGIKDKIKKITAVSGAMLIFATPAFAQNSQEPKERKEIKIEDLNYESEDKKTFEDYFKIFEKETVREYEIEMRYNKIWYESYFRQHGGYPYSGKFFEDYPSKEDKEFERKFADAMERALTSGMGESLSEMELIDSALHYLEAFTKINVIKDKNKDAKIKNPLEEKTEQQELEEKIRKLKELKKDYESIGDYGEAERLDDKIEDLEDMLYSNRKFKFSFGVDTNIDKISNIFKFDLNAIDPGLEAEFYSKYLDSKLAYNYKDDHLVLDLDKRLPYDIDINLRTDYLKSHRPEANNNNFDERELYTTLNVRKSFEHHLYASLAQSHNWLYKEDSTKASLSKVFTKGNKLFRKLGISNADDNEYMEGPVILSINSEYDWSNKDYAVSTNLRIDF